MQEITHATWVKGWKLRLKKKKKTMSKELLQDTVHGLSTWISSEKYLNKKCLKLYYDTMDETGELYNYSENMLAMLFISLIFSHTFHILFWAIAH